MELDWNCSGERREILLAASARPGMVEGIGSADLGVDIPAEVRLGGEVGTGRSASFGLVFTRLDRSGNTGSEDKETLREEEEEVTLS